MNEDDEQDGAAPEDDGITTEAMEQALDDGKGNKMVPLSALIAAKRENKAHSKRIKELEPVAARVTDIESQLGAARPYIDAIVTNPRLKAEALRAVNGTRPTNPEHAAEEVDPDLVAYAEDMGLYLADGVTPDAQRAGRVIARLDNRNRRTTEEAVRPFAGMALSQKAEANITAAMNKVDADGVPYATPEGLREAAKSMPANLLADPSVADLILRVAIGIDRMAGRTPKATEEPLFLQSAGGRNSRGPSVDPELAKWMKDNGVDEKAGLAAIKHLG